MSAPNPIPRTREYRVVSNGVTFRVQGREQHRLGPFEWWSRWTDLGGCVHGPFWSVREYETEADALAAVARAKARDEILGRPWQPIGLALPGEGRSS